MILRAEKVTRQYFRQSKGSNVFVAVQETDFALHSGELIEIIGRSGSGKSTLLNMLAGLLKPTSGKVYFDDTDIYALGDGECSRFRNAHIGVIPQGQTGLHSLTVMENVLLPFMMYGFETGAEDYAAELLGRVGIADLKNAYPNELSGGEMRRLSIARALVKKPEVLLCDEPTGDLDDENTQAVLRLLRQAADNGTAVLLVTHEKEAAEYADQIYRMNAGILS